MITELTPAQEAKMAEYVTTYVKIGLDTNSIDLEETRKIIDPIYTEILNLPKPEIIIRKSPLDCWNYIQEQVGQKMDFVWPYFCGAFDANIFAYYDYCINELGVEIETDILQKYNVWREIMNLGIVYAFDDVCIVSEKPTAIYTNSEHQLHNENGPALTYADGFKLWCLNGVLMNEDYIMTPWDKIDCQLVIKETNAEVRRELVRKIGNERLLKELNSKIADTATRMIAGKEHMYELLLLDIGDNNHRPYLKMINPSIGTYHIEGVHPDCQTVEDALNWRNGTKDNPIVLT